MASGSEGFKKLNQNRKKAGQGKPSAANERASRRQAEAVNA